MSTFKLENGVFYRLEDNKEIAKIDESGAITGLHHKQERFREELESLIVGDNEAVVEIEKPLPVIESSPAPSGDDTPRDLFDKCLGDVTPAVIKWRVENWPESRFQELYKGRNIETS